MINDHKPNNKTTKVWTTQISMCVNFISSRDAGEIRTINLWSNNESIIWVVTQIIVLKNFSNIF